MLQQSSRGRASGWDPRVAVGGALLAMLCVQPMARAAAAANDAAPPAGHAINILVEGQSNGVYFMPQGAPALRGRVEKLLGFDGVHDTVTIRGGVDCSTWGATALIPSKLAKPANTWLGGSRQAGWTDGALQSAFIACLRRLPAPVRAAPTVTLWLHNENDSRNEKVLQADWESAIRYNVAETRAALGQNAATTPVDFVFVPFDFGTGMLQHNGHSGHVQALKAGFEALAADPTFNATIAAQMGDADMDGPPGTQAPLGGPHFGTADMAQMAQRVALTIATQFRAMARPGAPAATGTLDHAGPQIIAARRAGDRQVAVTVHMAAGAPTLQPLSTGAQMGAGWCLVAGTAVMRADVAQLAGGQVMVTFPGPVPAGARLFYPYGDGRIYVGHGVAGPGRGMAVYDSAGLPAWGGATGVKIEK